MDSLSNLFSSFLSCFDYSFNYVSSFYNRFSFGFGFSNSDFFSNFFNNDFWFFDSYFFLFRTVNLYRFFIDLIIWFFRGRHLNTIFFFYYLRLEFFDLGLFFNNSLCIFLNRGSFFS
jgi:hypothetical protein